jgi:dihydroflavonol-4-reductase
MGKVLVTGAAGFIGSALVQALLKRNFQVKITVRQQSDRRNLQGLDVEECHADITDKQAMLGAMEGCSLLYHVAAIYRTWMRDYKQLRKVNVEGTRTVFGAALESGIQRVVHTSSIGALGMNSDGYPSDEKTPFNLYHLKIPYEISKYESEQVVLDFFRKGLSGVIVRPALVMGVGDLYPTPSGKMVLDILKKRIFAYFDGAIDIVDVEDVALGHILAMEKGVSGDSYNLGNQENFVSLRTLFLMIAEIGGIKPPRISVPTPLALAWAQWETFIADHITHRQPAVTPGSVRVLSLKRQVDFSKAIRELGIPQTPLRKTIEKTVRWYRKEGYC